jgi:hypothetical protein
MHISEFGQLIETLNNQYIVITHTTQRTPMFQIRKILKDALSPEKYARIILFMDQRDVPK